MTKKSDLTMSSERISDTVHSHYKIFINKIYIDQLKNICNKKKSLNLKLSTSLKRARDWQKRLSLKLCAALIVTGLAAPGCATGTPPDFVSNAHLPTDANDRCPVTEETMKSWFRGNITKNGWVNPADSTATIFNPGQENTRCDFYKWGAQMFLWLTSETGALDKHVFSTSPVFYDISIADASIGKREFIAGNGTMDLVPGTKDNIEFGQASDSDILISQDESIVYFGLHANNVFALYTTGLNEGWFSTADPLYAAFPDSKTDLDTLKSKVSADKDYKGYSDIEASEALAMELKTAWVDASLWTQTKQVQYITTEANVPVFDRSLTKGPWPIIGNEKKTLAMVGMHVVGTVEGHPEMVWSTFEHVNNAPANTFRYNANNPSSPKNPITKTQWYDSTTNEWTFFPTNASGPATIEATGVAIPCVVGKAPTTAQKKEYKKKFLDINQCGARAIGKKGSITNQIISPTTPTTDIIETDVVRIDAWGGGTVANNTDLISLNTSILTWLKPGDYRGNYIQTGGIWTSDGSIPTNGKQSDNPHLVGSLKLANTTMETYDQQEQGTDFYPINCFGCHGASSSDPAFSVSHIIQSMESLPKNPE